ncbi:isopeptide-forming domain-containing fimbrial protein, partial [Streptococcus gallolyticus]|nr:isopeptide-forming domain-containing fimbrial protein [Streptococcus gallolyticus]
RTPPVNVTPPPTQPTIEKKIVDGDKLVDELNIDTQKPYEYEIKVTLPSDIAKYDNFQIYDDVDKRLEVKSVTVQGDHADKFTTTGAGVNAVRVDAKKDQIKNLPANETITVRVKAEIKAGVTETVPNTALLITSKPGKDGTPGVPNKPEDPNTPKTPPVNVTPPTPTEPTITKKIVDGDNRLDEMTVDNETDYDYEIIVTLPSTIKDYTQFDIKDTVDSRLAVQKVEVTSANASSFTTTASGENNVVVSVKDGEFTKLKGEDKVVIRVTAQMKAGVLDTVPNDAFIISTHPNADGTPGRPNKPEDPNTPKTPPVNVTPPTPNQPPIVKKVNNADSATLKARTEIFTYSIETTVPTGAFAFEVTDTLKEVLSFEGAVKATVDGQMVPSAQITTNGQDLRVTLTKEQVKAYAGKAMQVVFAAKVKDGADLTPYMVDGQTSIPNTANYLINNNPATKKDSNTVPVVPPTPNEPGIDKKINRTETHLDIPTNQSYMYNVNADIPADISTYREFIVTDNLVDALAINGDVVAYVDGYTTDAVKVTVEGNRVIATVVDFAKLAGYKQIQLYIPAYIKSDADLTAYMTNNVASIPNTANLDFTDSNGVKKHKDTVPVTVTPPTPNTPNPPTPQEPTPDAPVKTVSGVDGKEQALSKLLAKSTDAFRFDIKSVVPADQADDKRINLTSLTVTDTLDALFTVKKEQVAVKVSGTPAATANYIDEDVEKAQAALDAETAKLEEIKTSSNAAAAKDKVTEAQATVTELEAALAQAQAKLAELKAPATTDTTTSSIDATTTSGTAPATDNTAAIAEQEKVVAELDKKVTAAKATLTTAQEALATAKTDAEVRVEVANQEKVVVEKQKALDQVKEKQAKLQAKLAELEKVNDKGELTAEAIVALGGTIKVEGQLVTVDFSDEFTMEALKGRTVSVIIYSSIKDVKALTDVHFTKGIENTATVQFNHNPNTDLTKKTNTVTVIPPKPEKPTPPPTTPDEPKGDLPTPPTPQGPTPTPKKVLPRTGSTKSDIWALVGMGLAGILAYAYGKKRKDS